VIFSLVVFIYTIYFFFVRRHVIKGGFILVRLGFLVLIFTFFWGSAAGGRLYDALGNVDKTNLQLIANTLSGAANFFVWTCTSGHLVTWVSSTFLGGDSAVLATEATWETAWNTTDGFLGSETELSRDNEEVSRKFSLRAEDLETEVPNKVGTLFSINSGHLSTSYDNQPGSLLVDHSPLLGTPPLTVPRSRFDS